VVIGILLFGIGIYLLGFVQAVIRHDEFAIGLIAGCLVSLVWLIYRIRSPCSNP
jgi:hypothetical protein